VPQLIQHTGIDGSGPVFVVVPPPPVPLVLAEPPVVAVSGPESEVPAAPVPPESVSLVVAVPADAVTVVAVTPVMPSVDPVSLEESSPPHASTSPPTVARNRLNPIRMDQPDTISAMARRA
jgi:hypothetical protein